MKWKNADIDQIISDVKQFHTQTRQNVGTETIAPLKFQMKRKTEFPV